MSVRWQRPARWLIAGLGVAFAVSLFVLQRDRPAPAGPVPAMDSDPEALSESSGGRIVSLRNGEIEFTIDHEGQRSYADRQVFLKPYIRFVRSGQEIRADRLETRGKPVDGAIPAELELIGHVRLTKGDHISVEADGGATYDDAAGALNMPGPVTFTRGDLHGAGTGATYQRDEDLFQILADATAQIAGDESGEGQLDLSASRMSLAGGQNYLLLEEDARIVRAGETLTGNAATISFAEDNETIRFLELRGGAAVSPVDPASHVPAMNAEDITLSFHAESKALEHATLTGNARLTFREPGGERAMQASWIDMYLAPDGRTLTRLDGRDRVVVQLPPDGDRPARDIRSTTLVAKGTAAAGLQTAVFDGGAEFIEHIPASGQTAAATRTGKARSLHLALDGGLDAIDEAEFRQDVSFASGEMRGEAELARYHAARAELVLLRAASGSTRQPAARREDGSFVVDADQIDLALDSEDLRAAGAVRTVSRQADTARDSGSRLFEAGKPVYGSSDGLRYTHATGQATYVGQEGSPARLVQDENRIAGREIVVDEKTNDLRATGRVESSFVEPPPADAPEGEEPKLNRISADEMAYDERARTATYLGAPVTFRSAGAETTAEKLVLRLDEGRSVLGFEATGATVFIVLPGGHEAKGAHLTYDRLVGSYTLRGAPGRPAQAKSPQESGKGCVLSTGVEVVFTSGTGAASWRTPPTGLGTTTQIDCGVSIR